jgi:hypothetical protein
VHGRRLGGYTLGIIDGVGKEFHWWRQNIPGFMKNFINEERSSFSVSYISPELSRQYPVRIKLQPTLRHSRSQVS